jgi:hypothetical protein
MNSYNPITTTMNEIIAKIILDAIDPAKIPALDYFEPRQDGFNIHFNDGTIVVLTVQISNL